MIYEIYFPSYCRMINSLLEFWFEERERIWEFGVLRSMSLHLLNWKGIFSYYFFPFTKIVKTNLEEKQCIEAIYMGWKGCTGEGFLTDITFIWWNHSHLHPLFSKLWSYLCWNFHSHNKRIRLFPYWKRLTSTYSYWLVFPSRLWSICGKCAVHLLFAEAFILQ